MLAAVLCVLSIVPQRDSMLRESVDLIEVNHFYDDHCRLVFDQVIFYDWTPAESRYNVRAWRLVKSPQQLPQRDWDGGGCKVVLCDGDNPRFIRSKSIRETWTQYDPELPEREFLPKEKRKELKSFTRR